MVLFCYWLVIYGVGRFVSFSRRGRSVFHSLVRGGGVVCVVENMGYTPYNLS